MCPAVRPSNHERIQLTRPASYSEEAEKGEVVNPKDVLLGEPIVGQDPATHTERGPGALEPNVMTSKAHEPGSAREALDNTLALRPELRSVRPML